MVHCRLVQRSHSLTSRFCCQTVTLKLSTYTLTMRSAAPTCACRYGDRWIQHRQGGNLCGNRRSELIMSPMDSTLWVYSRQLLQRTAFPGLSLLRVGLIVIFKTRDCSRVYYGRGQLSHMKPAHDPFGYRLKYRFVFKESITGSWYAKFDLKCSSHLMVRHMREEHNWH